MADPGIANSPSRRPLGAVLVLLCALAAAGGGYAFYEHSLARQWSAQNEQLNAALNDTRGQIEALTAKLNALSAPPAPAPAAASASRRTVVKRAAAHRRRSEDPRWKQVQAQLAEHQKEIESTQQDLASARSDLQGSIAKTHDELVALQKKGERNYYEFDLDKSGQFQREGPVGLRLRKANTKHQYADLEMLVDDIKLSKKHVNLYEPVLFFPEDNPQPVQLVINRITKKHIHGYVSEPKYRGSEVATTAGNTPAADAAAAATGPQGASVSNPSAAPPVQRRRLGVPQ